jgi:subtilisin family serine protease
VNPFYIDSLSKIPGVQLINTSKWLNQALIEIDDASALDIINAYPFVKKSNKITYNRKAKISAGIANNTLSERENMRNSVLETAGITGDTINYGNNYGQVHIHEGEYLHKLGYRGQGIIIAMLDGGYFQYKTNPAFDSLRLNNHIVSEYDFVVNETSVNEDNVHGAICLSTMAANRPGVMVGTAPGADYILFRTEDVASEKPVEEQYWIAGLERADSIGADMLSSSLGYTNFDDAQYNHTYAQRNGNTAMITIAADMAAKKGIIVMNAAGNSGNATNDTKYIMCPADGDSVVAVGAVNVNGVIGGFSSWGPNGAGKIKPNIVSVGAGAVYANTTGNTSTANGTSLATPNIAGLIACLWQAFPDFTNMEIIDAVQRSADRFNSPDERYGNGIPNFRIAYGSLMVMREKKLTDKLKDSWIAAYPVPFDLQFNVLLKAPASGNAVMRLIDIAGHIVYTKNMQVLLDNYYTIDMRPPYLSSGVYYLHYSDGKNKKIIKLIRL